MHPQIFSAQLTQLIRESPAYDHLFFKRAKACTSIAPERLQTLCRSWYEITHAFGLSVQTYPRVLVREIAGERNPSRRQRYEAALQQATTIAGNDLGLQLSSLGNPSGPPGIHYHLFATMVTPILSRKELERWPHPLLLTEANLIAERFWILFGGVASGAAALRVVEEIAFTIVDSLLPLFLAVEKNGEKVFTPDQLLYITLHRQIEGRHATQADDMASLRCYRSPEIRAGTEAEVYALTTLFGRFWSAVEQVTFET